MLMVSDTRRAAWEKYESLPWPVRTDEEWRRTDPKLLPPGPKDPESIRGVLKTGWEAPAPELIRSGVILSDLETAAKQFPDLVEQHLFQTGETGQMKKFVALHQAVSKQGLFCYVPDGVKVAVPLRGWMEAGEGSVFPHLLIIVGKGAELTLVDERRSADSSAPVFSNEMVEAFVRQGGFLRYVRLQRWSDSVTELFSQRVILEQDARFLNITAGFGGKWSKSNAETVLLGPGARADLLGIFFGANNQHYDVHTLQDHQAPQTASDLLYKSALADKAESVYTGLIRIAKHAQKCDAFQANRNLLLSQGAKADAIPMLEIETDDVRCTHGVAVGPVDEEQAFYLMSRGIPAREAELLIVEGFFEQILKRIPIGDLREQLAGEIAERLSNHTETKES